MKGVIIMKKGLLTKIATLGLALVMAISPITASAAEKKVVSREDYDTYCTKLNDKYEGDEYWEYQDEEICAMMDKEHLAYIKSLNGCFQPDGRKIYTVLNDSKKTFTKTGKYSVVVGGTSAKKDQGYVVFKAPATGTYKFTFVANKNTVGDAIFIESEYTQRKYKYEGTLKNGPLTYYKHGKKSTKPNCAALLLADGESYASVPLHGGIGDLSGSYISKMQKVYATMKLAKGESIAFVMRSPSAAYNEEVYEAYNFVGANVDIKKIK